MSERGWSGGHASPTTLVLVRHGVTEHTAGKRFSSGLGGADPGLTDDGRAQARAAADWLAPMRADLDALVTSPVRRTRESAAVVAEVLGLEAVVEAGLAEMEFGAWDALSFAEVQATHPDELQAWLGSVDVVAGGHGESFRVVEQRVIEARDRLVTTYAGQTVVAVSHVTPIKVLVADALGAPLEAVFRMELSPASVTVIGYYDETAPVGIGGRRARASLRLYNARPTDRPFGS